MELIGYVAAVLTVASFVPQAIRVWRTKSTTDLSLGMIVLLVTSAALWIFYGSWRADWPVVLTNGANVMLIGSILIAKLKYK